MTTALQTPAFTLGPRTGEESYGMRGFAGRPSDRVHRFARRINGKPFEFVRIVWADGGVTVRAYEGGTPTVLHEWTS